MTNPVYAITANSLTAETFRQAPSSFVAGTGVVGSGDLAVSQEATPAMEVQVAAGQVWVPGTLASTTGFPTNLNAQTTYGLPSSFNQQGSYFMWANGVTNVTISASDPVNPRIDIICAYVQDAAYAGSNNQGVIGVITGTPAASPSAPSAPASAVVLAQVAVAAGASSIVNADITDERPKAGLGVGTQPWALAQASGTTTVANITNTQVNLGSLIHATAGFTLASNDLTVPAAGTYMCFGSVNWTNNNSAGYQAAVGHNGSVIDGSFGVVYGNPSTAGSLNPHAIYPVVCAAGDTLSLWTYQNAGGPLTTDGTFLDRSYLMALRISS